MSSDSPSLGAALRAAREAAGMSVEQVSAQTRIRGTLVRDLEADNFTSSMGVVYARGHVKSIAAALGADPLPLLRLFDDQAGPNDEAPTVVEVASASSPVGFDGSAFAASAASLRPERRTPRWGMALAGAAGVLGLFVAIGYTRGPAPASIETAFGQPSASPSASQPASVRTPAPDSVAARPVVTGAQLRLRLIGGTSWVSVSNASGTLFEGILRSGQFRDFSDPQRLKIVLGNAAPVNLNCGGTDSGPAGRAGQVMRFECTAGGLKPL